MNARLTNTLRARSRSCHKANKNREESSSNHSAHSEDLNLNRGEQVSRRADNPLLPSHGILYGQSSRKHNNPVIPLRHPFAQSRLRLD
jgi:hypothetical protein